MKHNYLNLQRLALMYALAVWLVVLTTGLAMAQQRAEIDPGVLRFKVTEELALQLEASRPSLDANNVLLTGIQSLDRANTRYKASVLRRVFRPAGKFEAKHRRYGLHRWYEARIDKAVPVSEALDFYRSIEGIEKVEPSYKKSIIGSHRPDFGPIRVSEKAPAQVPLVGAANDPLLPNQWHYNNTGQAGGTPGSDISLFEAWTIETGTPNVIVAVTDGGAQVNHPDLAANMWVNTGEIPGNDLDDDNNGFVDDVNGYGFGDDTGEIAPDDHGTHTSGTIAAVTNNGVGVAGVAGGSGAGDGARIMTLATFGGESNGGFGESYVYGADNGAVISQNSWGYNGPDFIEPSVKDGIDYFIAEAGIDENGNQVGPMRGGIVIFAAGNDNDNDEYYPGFYDKTLAVGGLTNQDKKAWYSNFGDWVDMSAPGGETFVANDPRGVLSTVANSQYAFFQGTSMACPHVSGVAALIVSKYGGAGFTPEILRERLTQLVDNVDAADPGFAGLLGTGRLNAFKALIQDDAAGPEAITDLATAAVGITSVTLRWTSPADAGAGSASTLDVRYATFPITSANFNTATAVASPPAPLPPGATQTYTVTGLSPGTTYYFAIRSADFFGNLSAISNVLTQATNFPPQVSVSPDTITETLQTAQVTTRLLTITNSGQGELAFAFDGLSASDFATPSPANGIVASFDTLQVSVTIDANGLLPGTYHQNLILASNDPANPSITVPVILTVISNGKPIASIASDSLDFGQVYVTDTTQRTVTVHNAGAEPLSITSVTSSNADFIPDFTGTITVAPFDSAVITITYAPSSLGIDTGTLTVATNDSTNATLVVHLQGEGVPAPSIIVTPAALSASLNTGGTTTRTLTISNTGGSNLEFTATVEAQTPVAITTVQTITLPVSQVTQQGGALQKTTGNAGYGNQVQLKSAAQSAAVANVLILSPDNNVADIEAILDAFSDVEADVFPKASLPAITLADLSGYDVVFTTNNTQWLGSGGVQPAVIGDLLADYIDAGGKVISNQFNYSYDAWKLEGRFIDEQYGPFIPATTDANISVSLGDILAPGHPIVEGVSELQYDGFVQNVSLAPGAIALAEWSNNALFLAANTNVVALNLLPSLGNGGPLQFTGDLPLIYQNAIHYLAGPGFVSVSPAEGVVAAGTQLDLLVTFDATGLDSGVYEASINIASNAPNQELVAVPATLTVLGPEFTVSPTSLEESLEKDQTSVRTLVISNNGPNATTFTADVQGIGTGQATAQEPETAGLARLATTLADRADVSLQKATQAAAADFDSEASVDVERNVTLQFARSAVPVVLATETQYATDFENFSNGDVSGQQDWFGQFGNWTIETANAYSGSRHFRGLSDGLGTSAAISPSVPIGTEAKSTTSMKLDIRGTGVTWQILPQSPTAALVNTRIQFAPNGVASALVKTASGGAAFVAFGTTPTGYFDLTIEVDRDSAYFHVYIDDTRVFTGQGFTGNIEEVAVLSGMQVAGPTLDLDDLKIIDGKKEPGVSFLNVSPLSGNLPSGASVTLNVSFNSSDLEFGTYNANINIKVAQTKFTVPASLRVFGDPEIDVDPTYLQATVDYREDSTRILTIQNTGGNPLNYSLQVIGAATNGAALVVKQQKKTQRAADARTLEKIARDERDTRPVTQPASAIQLLTGPELLREDFEDASFPPAGWQVVDNEGTGVVWNFAATYGEDNYAGTGEAATASSDAAGVVEFDTELITPVIPAAGKRNVTIQYNVNYQNLAGLDFLDLDIQVDGGAWKNVLRWNEDHGTLRGTGVSATVQLEDHIGGGSSFRLRWHYYDPNTDDFDWYAQIDDVVIYENPRPWLTVSPASGTVPVQGTANIEARFNAKDVAAGSYVGGILVSSNASEDPLVGVVAQLTVRPPASMSVTPDSLYQELLVDETATQTITIANTGASALKFAFGDTPIPAAVVTTPQQRREPAYVRTTPSTETVDLAGIRAIASGMAVQASSVPLYVTGFEDFAPGDINGQNGWVGQFGDWEVEALHPFEDVQHIRAIADGLGASRAFSPSVAIGSDPISSASLRVYAEPNVTWQVIPQSPAAGLVNTRIQIAPDGTLSALVKDSLGNAAFAPVNVTLAQGYFELRIDVERATDIFTLRIDGIEVFTGLGFAGDIEQLVLFAAMEIAGPVIDIDNVAIFDGPVASPWLSYGPKSGIVPAGGTASITVNFNATKQEAGLYTETLTISGNDPAHRTINVPVTLRVLVNTPPVLAAIDTVTVIENATANVTFTATDVDNEPVTVVLAEDVPFITLVSTTNGQATYRIQPVLGNGGEYDFTVTATDARGKQDSGIFHLSVTPYGLESFTLFNTRTNRPVTIFTDTVSIDIANPDLGKLTVHANTNPVSVGSVKFWVNNRYKNVDNTKPYALNTDVIKSLDGGDNVLLAKAYTSKNGGGSQGKSLAAVIRIVNSAAVTDFDVVKLTGGKLADLANGAVIDISKHAYKYINIKANTAGSKIKSVVFALNGVVYRTDNLAPYQLGGIGSLIDLPWKAVPGAYKLTATPYSDVYGGGVAGQPLTISFTVVNGTHTVAGLANVHEIDIAEADLLSDTDASGMRLYPVPVNDVLHIRLDEREEGYVGMVIHNAQGQQVLSDEGTTLKFEDYSVSTSRLTPGVYYVRVVFASGRQVVRKFIKA